MSLRKIVPAVAVLLAFGAGPVFADEAAAKKWINDEFQPSTLSKEDQLKELQWFIKAAKPFKGMDVWHWTSLVVLLSYAGLVSIPEAYYQAAKIDGARPWAVFRYIQLPKLKYVLTIAILLRFMDSFMVYTEVVVLTGGGPGNSTTFLSIDLVKTALGQFDLGPAAAMSLIYFLIVLLFSWLFYTLMMRNESR